MLPLQVVAVPEIPESSPCSGVPAVKESTSHLLCSNLSVSPKPSMVSFQWFPFKLFFITTLPFAVEKNFHPFHKAFAATHFPYSRQLLLLGTSAGVGSCENTSMCCCLSVGGYVPQPVSSCWITFAFQWHIVQQQHDISCCRLHTDSFLGLF